MRPLCHHGALNKGHGGTALNAGGGVGSGIISWYHLQDLENEAQDLSCVTQRMELPLKKNTHKRRLAERRVWFQTC